LTHPYAVWPLTRSRSEWNESKQRRGHRYFNSKGTDMCEWVAIKFGSAYAALVPDDGQGATEYAMVIGVLVVLLGVSLGVLGLGIENFLGRVADKLDLLLPAAA
jgi:hypothetical protein